MSADVIISSTQLPASVESVIRSRLQELQVLPEIAVQALEVARDSNCSVSDVTEIVKRDLTLTAEIVRMANSPLFSSGKPTSNLDLSVMKLGFRQCSNLIFNTCVASLLKKMPLQEEWVREVLTKHGFVTAALALHLNRTLKTGFHGEEFTAGMIHDFGRLLLAICLPDQFSAIDALDFIEGPETLIHERTAVATDHCEVGVWFAEFNQLPIELRDVICFHHDPAAAVENKRLVTLISIADHMANHLQRGVQPQSYKCEENTAISVLAELGFPDARRQLEESACRILTQASDDSAAMMSF